MTTEEQRKKWRERYERNKEKYKEWQRNNYHKKCETDPEFKEKQNSKQHFRKFKKTVDEMVEKGKPVEL